MRASAATLNVKRDPMMSSLATQDPADMHLVQFVCSCDHRVAALIRGGDTAAGNAPPDPGDSSVVCATVAADTAYKCMLPPAPPDQCCDAKVFSSSPSPRAHDTLASTHACLACMHACAWAPPRFVPIHGVMFYTTGA